MLCLMTERRMVKNKFILSLNNSISKKEKQLAILIDPDVFDNSEAEYFLNKLPSPTTHIFVGGSSVEKNKTEATVIALKKQKNLPISSIKFNDDVLAWAANENSKKRFKSNTNLWTLQATLNWSKKTINKYKTDDIRKMIGIVTQESLLFHDTIRNNICLKAI